MFGQRNSAKTRDECNLDKNGSDRSSIFTLEKLNIYF